MPFGLVTGLNAVYLSGTPINKLGSHTFYGVNERFVAPRGTAGRTADIFQLDLHLAYGLPIGRLLRATLIADVFNATNSRTETVVDQTWTFAQLEQTVDPNECGGPARAPERVARRAILHGEARSSFRSRFGCASGSG